MTAIDNPQRHPTNALEQTAEVAHPPCRLCGGPLRPSFDVEVLGDTKATYEGCSSCGSLMVVKPHWLDRSYALKIFPDPDTGALKRTLYVDRYLRRMRTAGLLPPRYRSLDYGSGLGMLVNLQLDRGARAKGFDRYAEPRFAQLECSNVMPEGSFDLITMIEVAEHLLDPIEVLTSLRARLDTSGILVISTELYDPKRVPEASRWHYLAVEHGQHITLFTRLGLARAAEAAGLRHVHTVNWNRTPFLHVLIREERPTPRGRLAILALEQALGELRENLGLGV